MLHLVCLHLADDRPAVLEDRWLNPETLKVQPDFHLVSANEWLLANVPYTTGDISLSAANASADEARLLDLPPGSALFIIDRTTWDRDHPVTCVRLAHVPGFRMRTTV